MDSEKTGGSLRAKIAAVCKVTGEEMWHGCRRTSFMFNDRKAWVVAPSVEPAEGIPWTWSFGDPEAFVKRMAVPELLKEGFHHVWIDLAGDDDAETAAAEAFHGFLAERLGFSAKANLIGAGSGGEAAIRFAAKATGKTARIYLDNPLFSGSAERASALAAAKIGVLLVYGEDDRKVPPAENAVPFAAEYKASGGEIEVHARAGWGHFPYGFDMDENKALRDFFTR